MSSWKETGVAILGEVIDLGVNYLKNRKTPTHDDIKQAMLSALDSKRALLAEALATEVFAALGRGAEQVLSAMKQAEELGRARGRQTFLDTGATYEEWDGKKDPEPEDADAVTTQKIPKPGDL